MENLTRNKWRSLSFSAGGSTGEIAANRMIANLGGKWVLILAAVDSRTTTGHTRLEHLPPALKVVHTIDTTSHPFRIKNDMHFGIIPLLRLSGSFDFRKDSRQFESIYDQISVLDVPIDNMMQPMQKLVEDKIPPETANETQCDDDTVSKVEGIEESDDGGGGGKHAYSWMARIWRWGKRKVKNLTGVGKSSRTLLSGTWAASFTESREKDAMEKVIDKLLGLDKKGDAGLGGGLLRMEQSFNLGIPAGLQWDVYIGDYLVARLLGKADLSLTKQLLPKNIELNFGKVSVLGVELDLVRGTAGSTFTWICADEDIAVARDEDGDLLLLKRLG